GQPERAYTDHCIVVADDRRGSRARAPCRLRRLCRQVRPPRSDLGAEGRQARSGARGMSKQAITDHDSEYIEYVTVIIGEQLFGLPISKVQDVFSPDRLTRVPLAPR